MKLMKLFLTGVLAVSALAPSAAISMEPAQKPTGPATIAEITQAQVCAICQDDLSNGQDVRTLRCNQNGVPHIFHRACINDWLVSRQRDNQPALCPMCQTPAVPEFTLKEQIIAKAGEINYKHNPLSIYNRKLTAYEAGISAAVVGTNILTIPLLFKYLGNKDVNYLGTVREFARFGKAGIAIAFLYNYIAVRYGVNYLQGTNHAPQNFVADHSSLLKFGLSQIIVPAALLAALLQLNILKVSKS